MEALDGVRDRGRRRRPRTLRGMLLLFTVESSKRASDRVVKKS